MPLSSRVADLAPFELLDTIATTGSIGRCARHHGVSQPAVSARIKALETALGITLLHRHSHGARLTPTAALILEWAQPALEAAERLDQAIGSLTGTDAPGHLAVAASTTIAEHFFPAWLVALKSRLGPLHATLRCHNSADVVTLVQRGGAELGFAEAGHVPHDLDHRPIVRDRLVVLVSPEHPWTQRDSIDPTELAAAPLILRELGSGTRSVLEEHLAQLPEPLTVHPTLELTSTAAIKNAAASGLGPAVISSLAVTTELATGTLVEIPIPGLHLHRTLHAFWRYNHRFTTPARHLLDIATTHPHAAPATEDASTQDRSTERQCQP